MNRVSWEATWLDVAQIIARRGTCPKKQVGAVLVSIDNYVLSTGYNGALTGMPHCEDVGCLLNPAGKCMRATHAEVNALVRAEQGRLPGSTLYVTHQPCFNCASLTALMGVARVVYIYPHAPTFPDALEFLGNVGIEVLCYSYEGGIG